ncbi:MAG: ATP-binding protein [Acidimicrobiales bacterium]|jgi:type IV secretory pathway VirB4 component
MGHAAHEATTRNLGSLYPFQSEPGLGTDGAMVGRDLLGGTFHHDPFALYRAGAVTNPNMVVVGQIGRGKSAFVKTYLWRQAVFGRRAWVVDPKGEYGALARAWGVTPVALRPGGRVRLNPLDAPAARDRHDAQDTVRMRAELLASLSAASLGRSLSPPERTALELAVTEVSAPASAPARSRCATAPCPTLPAVVEALLHPATAAAATVGTDASGLAADGRNVALELRRLVAGDLRGMFDGETSEGLRLDASLVVLDLSAVYHSAALGVLMTCATAWLHAALDRRHDIGPDGGATPGGGVVLVVDEAWAILTNLAVARWLRSSWKLSRARGVANVAVVHRLSDLDASGASGSEQVGLAQGLVADSETRVVYAQPPGEVERSGAALGLSSTEADLVPHLRRGVALWKVGTRSFLVEHRLSPHEAAIVDTDGRMGGGVTPA